MNISLELTKNFGTLYLIFCQYQIPPSVTEFTFAESSFSEVSDIISGLNNSSTRDVCGLVIPTIVLIIRKIFQKDFKRYGLRYIL